MAFMTTNETIQKQIDGLLAQARSAQRLQFNAARIGSRSSAQSFGRLERELEAIWRKVDALRAELARPTVPEACDVPDDGDKVI
jgi:hypothetical protein